jgi:hypothetical protein
MVEINSVHAAIIKKNISKVEKCGCSAEVVLINADALDCSKYLSAAEGCDIIFADPPYDISAECFKTLFDSELFRKSFAGSSLFWEIPDRPGAAGAFVAALGDREFQLKKAGGTLFLHLII